MSLSDLHQIEKIGQTTPISNYPNIINDNFIYLENFISLFYNDNTKTYTNKDSDKWIIAPIYNNLTRSKSGYFGNINVDDLYIGGKFSYKLLDTTVTSDKIVYNERLDSNDFTINKYGIISIRKSDDELETSPTLVDSVGNISIGYNVKLPINKTCLDNICLGDKNTLSNLGASLESQYNNNSYNICFGAASLSKLTNGSGNIVIGATSATNMQTGSGNIVIGTGICNSNEVHHNKLFIGNDASGLFIVGDMENGIMHFENNNANISFRNDISIASKNDNSNIILGCNSHAISYLSSSDNIFIGNDVSMTIMGGVSNIFIGSNSGYNLFDSPEYIMCIGAVNTELGIDSPIIVGDMKNKNLFLNANTVNVMGDIYTPNIKTSGGGTAIGIDKNNNIVKFTSSLKYKKDITPINNSDSEKIYEIDAITYKPISETDNSTYYGFIAEDVAKVDDKLVGYTVIGNEKVVDSVMYDRFVVLLLNEVKKHERKITELEQTIETLTKK